MTNPLSEFEEFEEKLDPQEERNLQMAWLCYNFGLQPSEFKKLTIREVQAFNDVAKEIRKQNKK